jgi:hypothetical protein
MRELRVSGPEGGSWLQQDAERPGVASPVFLVSVALLAGVEDRDTEHEQNDQLADVRVTNR